MIVDQSTLDKCTVRAILTFQADSGEFTPLFIVTHWSCGEVIASEDLSLSMTHVVQLCLNHDKVCTA
jgi:hypothetical protein